MLALKTRAMAGLAVAALIFTVPPASARGAPDGFSEIAKKVSPAVVNVSTIGTGPVVAQNQVPTPQFPPGSPFDEMFKRFFQQQQPGLNNDEQDDEDAAPAPTPTPRRGAPVSALGSGFIIDAAGYVVTNNHVIARADKIAVTLTDGRKFDARLVGRDERTDLALLKIEANKPLPFVNFGDSDKAEVGDWIMAVGNPFGLGGTVTAGIVSARGRDIEQNSLVDFLQIDASINRGNSGGPTFNMDGEVIGINTAIFSPTGGSVGIGFAIPSSVAKPVLAQLRNSGRIDRGWLGVQIQPVTPDIAASLGMSAEKGALVAAVTPDSPASKAGMRQGDVVMAVNDQTVATMRDLPRLVANTKPGETTTMTVLRSGSERKLDVTIGALPNGQTADATPAAPAERQTAESRVLGLSLASLTPDLRKRFNLRDDVKGVVVTRVAPDSAGAEQGLQVGDVIQAIDNAPVTTPAEVSTKVSAARKSEKPAVLVLVNRRGNAQFVALKTSAA